MIDQLKAEEIATTHIENYVKKCNVRNEKELQNALLKMFSVCSQALVSTQGIETTLNIFEGTKNHIIKTNPTYSKDTVQ